jgi:hypothetical protein
MHVLILRISDSAFICVSLSFICATSEQPQFIESGQSGSITYSQYGFDLNLGSRGER